MARTFEANVILGLKDQLSKNGKNAAKTIDAIANALERAEKQAKEFAKEAGKMPKWGSGFQRQLDRLRLSAGEIDKIKKSWASLQKEIGSSQNKSFQTTAITRWKNEAVASILSVREAQRQLNADAIKDERARAAAETRIAAETAKEKMRLAKEAAKAAEKAEREAAARAKQLSREALNAKKTADREAAKSSRDTARAEQRAAKETARIAREEARKAAQEARRMQQEARRAERAAAQEAARTRRRLVGFGSDTVKNLGYAAGLGAGGYYAGRGLRATAFAGAELQREGARDYLGGLSAQDSARIQAQAFATSGRYKAVDAATMHSLIREGALTQMGLEGSLGLAPDLAKAMVVIGSQKGTDEALTNLTRFLRGLDNLGKNVDPKEVTALLNGFVQASGVEGAEFNPGDLYTFAKRSKSGGFSLDQRFLTRILPGLISDLDPQVIGTALGSSVSQIVGGRATKASKAEQQAYGMRDAQGNFLHADELLADPFRYTTETLVPLLQARDIDTDNEVAVTEAMSKLFSNQSVANLFGRMVLQAEQYLIKERKMDQAPGLDAADTLINRDPFTAAAGALDQLKNAAGALAEPIVPAATAALNSFGDMMARITGWLKDNGLAGTAGVLSGGAALGLGGFGAYKAGSLLFGGFGLTTAAASLEGSAAALTAAAVRLGGAGVVSDAAKAGGGAAAGSALAAGAVVGGVVVGGAGLAAGAANIYAKEPELRAPYVGNDMLSAMDPAGGLAAAVYAAKPAAQDAGRGIGSDIVAGIQASAPQAEAASASIFERIKAIFSSGVDVPIRPNLGGVSKSAGRWGPVGLGQDSGTGRAIGPGRASGGSVHAGGLYMINEFGQEYFSPAQNGTVHPAGRGGRGKVSIGPFHISGSAADGREIASEVARELRGVFADYGLDFA